MRASITRWGNSLAVRVPRHVAATLGVGEGAALELTVEEGAIVLRPRRHDIGALVAAMEGAEQPPLLLDDAPVGGEMW